MFMQGSGGFLGFRGSDFRVQGSGFGSYGVRVLGYLGLEVLRGSSLFGFSAPSLFWVWGLSVGVGGFQGFWFPVSLSRRVGRGALECDGFGLHGSPFRGGGSKP